MKKKLHTPPKDNQTHDSRLQTLYTAPPMDLHMQYSILLIIRMNLKEK